MKKLMLAVFVGTLPAMGMAASHPMAGCGLGYVLFSNKGNDKMTQIFGATTNGTFGSQTFGITSGTSGCTEDGAVKFVKQTEAFTEANLNNLRLDIAQGRGEYVNTLAALLQVKPENAPTFAQHLQTHYTELFPSSETSPTEFLDRIGQQLVKHPELIG